MAQLGATETSHRRQLQLVISASTCNGVQKKFFYYLKQGPPFVLKSGVGRLYKYMYQYLSPRFIRKKSKKWRNKCAAGEIVFKQFFHNHLKRDKH